MSDEAVDRRSFGKILASTASAYALDLAAASEREVPEWKPSERVGDTIKVRWPDSWAAELNGQ